MSTPDEDVQIQEAYPANEQAQKEMRVREQCYLVRNLNRYARSRLLGYEASLMPDGTAPPGKSAGYGASSGTTTIAQSFSNLVCTNAEPGKVVSCLAGTNDAAALLNIPSNVLSRLVPHIQLQKIYYDIEKGKSSSVMSRNGTVVSLPFANNYGPKTADDILRNKAGQGEGIGLKSLNVKFLGTNPAEVKTMLEVNMKIYARDFIELVKVRNSRKSASGEQHTAAFSDLITRDPRAAYETDRVFRGEVFRIRAIVGWAIPEGAGSSILEGVPDARKLKLTLKQTKMMIVCELAGHTINFNQDGSLELEVKYIGRLESEMRNDERSIFTYQKQIVATTSDVVKKAREALRKAKIKDEKEFDLFDDIADWTGQGAVGDAEMAYEKALAQAKQLKTEELGRAYKEFLGGFFKEKKHSLFWLRIPPYVYRQSIDPRVPNPEFGGATVLVERFGRGVATKQQNVTSGKAANSENEDVEIYQLHGYENQGDVWASKVGSDGKMKEALDDAFGLLTDEEGGGYE